MSVCGQPVSAVCSIKETHTYTLCWICFLAGEQPTTRSRCSSCCRRISHRVCFVGATLHLPSGIAGHGTFRTSLSAERRNRKSGFLSHVSTTYYSRNHPDTAVVASHLRSYSQPQQGGEMVLHRNKTTAAVHCVSNILCFTIYVNQADAVVASHKPTLTRSEVCASLLKTHSSSDKGKRNRCEQSCAPKTTN